MPTFFFFSPDRSPLLPPADGAFSPLPPPRLLGRDLPSVIDFFSPFVVFFSFELYVGSTFNQKFPMTRLPRDRALLFCCFLIRVVELTPPEMLSPSLLGLPQNVIDKVQPPLQRSGPYFSTSRFSHVGVLGDELLPFFSSS